MNSCLWIRNSMSHPVELLEMSQDVCLPQNLLTWPVVGLMSPGQGVQTEKVGSLRTNGRSIRGWLSRSWSTARSRTWTHSSSVPWPSGAACSRYPGGATHSLLSRGQCGARFQDLTSVLGAGLMEGKGWWKWSCREVSPVHPFIGHNNLQQGLGVLVYSPAKWGEE